jgi:branched-chain amino acid transport system substrate-binding protein
MTPTHRRGFLWAVSMFWLGQAAAAPPTARPADLQITLGQSASLSGTFASQAASYRDGALAYFHAVNAQGGVNGHTFKLLTLDDGYVVDRALENTKRLIKDDKVLALFGYTWTNTVKASLAAATAAGVPMIAPYTGYDELYKSSPALAFTTRASFSDELAQIVTHLHTIGLKRIGLLHYDSASGKELLAETRQRLENSQLTLSGGGVMKAGAKDPGAAVAALATADMQALIVGASGSDAVAFITAFEQVRRSRVQYYARSLIGSKQLVDELGPLAVGVSVSQTAPNPFKNRAPVAVEYRQLLHAYNAKLQPDYIGLEGLIAAKAMVEAVRRAGPHPSRESLVRALEQMKEYDVGGYTLRFGPGKHHGSRYVDITMLSDRGRVLD